MQPLEQLMVQLECPGAVHVDMIYFLSIANKHLRVGESLAQCEAPPPSYSFNLIVIEMILTF